MIKIYKINSLACPLGIYICIYIFVVKVLKVNETKMIYIKLQIDFF